MVFMSMLKQNTLNSLRLDGKHLRCLCAVNHGLWMLIAFSGEWPKSNLNLQLVVFICHLIFILDSEPCC